MVQDKIKFHIKRIYYYVKRNNHLSIFSILFINNFDKYPFKKSIVFINNFDKYLSIISIVSIDNFDITHKFPLKFTVDIFIDVKKPEIIKNNN